MINHILLGVSKHDDTLYLYKHSWDCNWYWGFGYIGNTRLHMHISALINHPDKYEPDWTDVGTHFADTWLTQDQWWILRDLFIAAYALKSAAEAYRHGGHQTASAAQYRVINPNMEKHINDDLKVVLDNIWNLLTQWRVEL